MKILDVELEYTYALLFVVFAIKSKLACNHHVNFKQGKRRGPCFSLFCFLWLQQFTKESDILDRYMIIYVKIQSICHRNRTEWIFSHWDRYFRLPFHVQASRNALMAGKYPSSKLNKLRSKLAQPQLFRSESDCTSIQASRIITEREPWQMKLY